MDNKKDHKDKKMGTTPNLPWQAKAGLEDDFLKMKSRQR